LQCGAVLPSSVRACNFCEIVSPSATDSETSAWRNEAPTPPPIVRLDDHAWRDELAHRLESYRGKKRKPAPDGAQTQLPFDSSPIVPAVRTPAAKRAPAAQVGAARAVSASGAAVKMALAPTVANDPVVPQTQSPASEDFSFTIAIGRSARKREDDTRMVIDVSLPPEGVAIGASEAAPPCPGDSAGLHAVATIEERRLAALIDAGCLLFAYGAFLALFRVALLASQGGDFTVNKLSGVVCLATFAIVYLQYFALFTIFGGTTPGMMLRGLEVVSFTGEPPTPRQMLWRSVGYVLSAGTFFLGFVWSMWDEDELTWHDRISKTYLHSAESFSEAEAARTATTH
jgi:uncharacterized RDD family membrane protein YckC